MVTTIFPADAEIFRTNGLQPTVIFQVLDENTNLPEIEYVFHLWDNVSIQGGVDLNMDSASARTPVSKLKTRRPNVARVSIKTATRIAVAREDGTTKIYQDNTDYVSQLQALDSMKGRLVRMVHRSGVVTGICTDVAQQDTGDVVGYHEGGNSGSPDARVRVEVEIQEVVRPKDGTIRLGVIKFPTPVPAATPSPSDPSLSGVLPGVGDHACVRTGGIVTGTKDAMESVRNNKIVDTTIDGIAVVGGSVGGGIKWFSEGTKQNFQRLPERIGETKNTILYGECN